MAGGKRSRLAAVIFGAALLAGTVLGCGSFKNGGESGAASKEAIGKKQAMGRFVEELTDISDKLSGDGNRFYRLKNGSLVITDNMENFLTTRDGGATYLTDTRSWRSRMLEQNTYIISVSIGADNTVGVIYQETESEEAVLNPRLLIVSPDKTETLIESDLSLEKGSFNQVYVSEEGRVFVTVRNEEGLYEIKENGALETYLLPEEGSPESIQFQGRLMVMDGYGYEGLLIYDMEKEEYIEDEVLTDFVKENYSDRRSGGNFYDMYFFFGEEGILYLAGEKGLYRHVIGGSAMEQVIDGNLCSLGNPAYALQGMAALDNNEFIALFEDCRLVRFTYHADIPTIPEETLRVYGLKDNEVIRQAINIYQRENPEVYIAFEFGMGEEDSVTREDALKRLNTEIMAGNGPDILLLDNMPVDSYVEKSMLLDLDSVLSSLEGEEKLFDNVIEAVKREDKVYMIPCEVRLPFMIGDEAAISSLETLEDIADMAENLRAENPEKDLLGFCSEKSIMRLFSVSSAPSWAAGENGVNKEAVEDFLKQTKRIYDAQMDGIPDKAVERYEQLAEDYMQYQKVSSFEDSEYVRRTGYHVMDYVGGYIQLLCGAFDYSDVVSIQKTAGFENTGWTVMKNGESHVFMAETLLGINAASKHIERAEDFLRVCLSKENQSYLYDSLSVNREAFDAFFLPEGEKEGEMYGSVVTVNEEGLGTVLVYYRPNGEQAAELRRCLEEADTAYIENDVLETAVYEAGTSYLQGKCSLEEAVNVIEKKVAIYIAE